MARRDGFNDYMAAAGFNESNSSSSDSSVSVRTSRQQGVFSTNSQNPPNLEDMRRRLMEKLAAEKSGPQSRLSPLMDLTGNRSGAEASTSTAASGRALPDDSNLLQVSEAQHSLPSIEVTHHESRMTVRTQSRVSVRDQRGAPGSELTMSPRDGEKRLPKGPSRSPKKSRSKFSATERPTTQRPEFNPKDYSTPFVHPDQRVSQGDSDRDKTFKGEFAWPLQIRKPGPKSRTSGAIATPSRMEDTPQSKQGLDQPEEEETPASDEDEERAKSPAAPTRPARQATVDQKSLPGPKSKKQQQQKASHKSPAKKTIPNKTSLKKRAPKTAKTIASAEVGDEVDEPALLVDTDNKDDEQQAEPARASPVKKTSRRTETIKTVAASKTQTETVQGNNEASTSRHDTRRSSVTSRDRVTVMEPVRAARKATLKGRRKQSEPQKLGTKVSRMMSTIRQIKQLQLTTNLLIPRLPFTRVVREVTQEITGPTAGFRYTADAVDALQTITEYYLTSLFCDANRVAAHANRVTVMPKDLELLRLLGLVERD
ncbi:histone H3.v1-like isoform X1 [Varroa jacobsoni]|uniref:Core Histone H2A/H2B/H3 domain-containing protein n=1 Tax=Varroa destructor TaxID=109461 RepID=A0A7M7JB69_VARDE|nr:histone H3.v1-like isoform X2 [Varroa destructor]XP_022700922.1 histone H3.v1-like isoform X1 [Varroa jacobsoni]